MYVENEYFDYFLFCEAFYERTKTDSQ